jgi:hypothetical protein
MLTTILETTKKEFQNNIDEVHRLMDFDRMVLTVIRGDLVRIDENIKKNQIAHPLISVEKSIKFIDNLHEHGSLKLYYKTILNQCIVLLVSYFGSTISELFEKCITEIAIQARPTNMLKEEVTVTIKDLISQENGLSKSVGRFLIEKKDISFQDMNSIRRAFKEHIEYEPCRDQNVNDIILAQASRHAIVHNGAIAGAEFINQIRDAKSRTIKINIELENEIEFSNEEINGVIDAMKTYLVQLCNGISERWCNRINNNGSV